jgi:hypothetical protein
MKLAYDPKSLEEMTQVREYLKGERNFAIKCSDWPRVAVYKQKLKHCENLLTSLRLHQKSVA